MSSTINFMRRNVSKKTSKKRIERKTIHKKYLREKIGFKENLKKED